MGAKKHSHRVHPILHGTRFRRSSGRGIVRPCPPVRGAVSGTIVRPSSSGRGAVAPSPLPRSESGSGSPNEMVGICIDVARSTWRWPDNGKAGTRGGCCRWFSHLSRYDAIWYISSASLATDTVDNTTTLLTHFWRFRVNMLECLCINVVIHRHAPQAMLPSI